KIFNQLNPKRQKFAAVETKLLSDAHRPITICLSDYVRRTILRYYTLNEQDLATLFNAVDLERLDRNTRPGAREKMREKLAVQPNQVAALMIAQDCERKGLREAIRAVAQANETRLKLIAMGKQDPAAYVDLAQSLGVDVTFCGPSDDVYPFY